MYEQELLILSQFVTNLPAICISELCLLYKTADLSYLQQNVYI